MNLPNWVDCNVKVEANEQLDPLEQFVYNNEPADDVMFRMQLQAALDFVLAPRTKKDGDGAPPRKTKKAVYDAIADQRPDWNKTVAASVDPVVAEAPPSPPIQLVLEGKTWKGTGKYANNVEGERVEIGSWINPAGEFEAARLTRETGVPHIIDPRTGDIVRAGGGTVEIAAPQLVVEDQKPVVADAGVLAGFDVRPALVPAKSFKDAA